MTQPSLKASVSLTRSSKFKLEVAGFEVRPGETVALLGRSGSGKSTLLRCMVGLEFATGQLEVSGKALNLAKIAEPQWTEIRRSVQLVLQNGILLPHITLRQNLMLAENVLGSSGSDSQYTEEILSAFELAHRSHAFPDELSGGELQRALIARAIALRSAVLLLDEPTASLDVQTVQIIARCVKQRELLSRNTGVLVATHDVAFAAEVASRVLFLEDGKVTGGANADELREQSATDSPFGSLLRAAALHSGSISDLQR